MIVCDIGIAQTRGASLILFYNMKHGGKADGIQWLDMTPLMALRIKILCVHGVALQSSN